MAWDKGQEVAFQRSKGLLQSADVLVHYNPTKPLVVACDASPYGLGAVLAHVMPDGFERPASFASCTLTPAEKNYSQLDREALAVVFATKKFHLFLYGKRFTLYTDHKPLLGIFGPSRGVPQITSPRRQRWILTMATYEFDLKHCPGGLNGNADGLSRLPLPSTKEDPPVPGEIVCLLEHVNSSVMDVAHIRRQTQRDPVLSRVLLYVQQGWPGKVLRAELKPYFARQNELSSEQGCVLWGARLVLPTTSRARVVTMLHETHLGITHMKALARSYIWWPGHGSRAGRESQGVSPPVRCTKRILLKRRCTLGSGQVALGLACIWIMQGHLWERCSWSSWMPTLSGWMCIQCHLPPQV